MRVTLTIASHSLRSPVISPTNIYALEVKVTAPNAKVRTSSRLLREHPATEPHRSTLKNLATLEMN